MPDDTIKIQTIKLLADDYLRQGKTDSALLCNQKSISICISIRRFDKMVDAYGDRQKIYSGINNDAKAFEALSLSFQKCRELNYTLGISNSCRNIAIYLFGKAEYHQALRFAKYGLATGDSVRDPNHYMSVLNNIGTCYSNLGNYNEAFVYLLRALRIAEAANDTFRVAAICNNVSQLYNRIGDTDKAKEYGFKSIHYIGRFDSLNLRNPYTNIAYIYLESEGKYDSALYYYKKAALLCEASGDLNLLSKTYSNISSVYRKTGDRDSAFFYIEKSLKAGYKSNNHEAIAAALSIISIDLMEKEKVTGDKKYFIQSLNYLKQALQHAEASENASIKQSTYQHLAVLYNEIGDYKSAYRFNLKFENIKDSLVNSEIINNTAKSEAKYQAEKSDKEIAENKIQLQQQDLQITKETAANKLLIAGLAVLFIFIIFGSITFVQRQKLAQKQKEFEKHKAIEQTRAAIAGDLHDDIGSTLSSVQFMSTFAMQAIDNSSPDARKWVKKIESNTGELLQDIRDIVWTLNPDNDNAADIIIRMRHFASQILEPKNILFDFEISGDAEKYLDGLIAKRNVFLIFKEAVNNAARYAETSEVKISLSMQNGKMKLVVADKGKGFDAATASSGSGLNNMKKRAENLNGEIEIVTSEKTGTTVTLIC